MEYTKLGHTGLDVSRLCLGTMGFGNASTGMFPWAVDETQSTAVIKQALDLGINFFDTANIYSHGDSERFVGQALKRLAHRDQIVLATKVFFTPEQAPNVAGLSRKAIMSQIDQSLERLQTDYVDLYIIHRWDYHTPIEETMEALHDVVKSGKARYIGASAMFAWQFEKAQAVAEQHGWTKFVSMQNHLNLLYREEEREMLPLCADQDIAVTPYSPLASGRLTRDWAGETKRYATDAVARSKYDDSKQLDLPIIQRVGEIAAKYGVDRVQVALAWLLQKPTVTAPIIGATKASHLTGAVKALDLKLTSADVQYLEEPYLPHELVGPLTRDQMNYQR
ncbi:MAG: aldo/keto reductase [Levilactobacillus sp.]|uniref:aldo/keto reductase n=1 Tax=Levilactobacillus sp. TaxID=2767919 RepID=UPI00258E8389|nr:aldo/keto reductase [Levilactobacillus sp.]MCI1553458.1 aldo/keto reductase [Levilactobacillus sp.]MCI1597847.1 aldo/keto reductase [Levilactobacillus sp.]MCI1605645.1 aldo/keto reductase [Levilactobacillus sp.]